MDIPRRTASPELRSILLQTVGVLERLGDVLSGLEGADEAFVFGSWAARFETEPGPFPNDVDVVAVGDVPLRSVRRKCREVEQHLRVDVNPVVIDTGAWSAPEAEPFVAHIREQPLVPISLDADAEG